METLSRLDICNNKITDVSALEQLVNLTHLDLSHNLIEVLPDLRGLINLSMDDTNFADNLLYDYISTEYLPSQLLEENWLQGQQYLQRESNELGLVIEDIYYQTDGKKPFYAKMNHVLGAYELRLTINNQEVRYEFTEDHGSGFINIPNLEDDFGAL